VKVCILLPSHPSAVFGGAEYQVSLFIERMLNVLPPMKIVYIARYTNPSLNESRYEVKQLHSMLGIRRLGFFTDSLSLYRSLQEADPDVIYQRTGCAYTGIAALYARQHGKKMIWHISIDGDLSNHTDRFPWLTRGIERKLRDYGIQKATHIVAQTADQARMLKAKHGRDAVIIRNFHPPPNNDISKAQDPTVVWVANMKPAKRPELFVEIAKHLSHVHGIRFFMAGRGGNRPPYQEMVENAERTLPLKYLGELSQDAVNELIGSAWVLVNTSVDEGFPNTFIQAWQRGTLVASLSVNPDGVLDMFGVVGNGGDSQLIAQKIDSLISSPPLLGKITSAAERYAAQMHASSNADRLIELCAE
jgi:glycosyltransferase involved in cell wall biosynthesis